ncbi:MAG: diguanylate cyclase [Deltaproteobacteria bacterium]|nr:diguanylate cyclase [Deltaproteobacteria bacterium]MCL4873640.1 diguanylate cyclase [bacterium]
MGKGRILVIDDDAFFRVLCSDMLTGGGYSVKVASSGKEALAVMEDEGFDIVMTDLVMPDLGGMEVLERVKQKNTLTDVILVTGHGSIESAIAALRSGAFDYIMKPLNEAELLHTIGSCMEKRKLLEENQEMRQSLRLFEVSRAITTTLDISRLYELTLDALLQTVPADSGIATFHEHDLRTLAVKASRHIDPEQAELLAGLFKTVFERDCEARPEIRVFPMRELGFAENGPLKGFESFIAAPLVRGQKAIGYFILLSRKRKEEYSEKDLMNASFIAEHASTAYENAEKYADAKEMAFIDSLTNLYNAKYLDLVLDKEIKRADRLRMPVTVLFLDLDNFKNVNDSNDHLVGSRVLVELGHLLLKCVREVDTVIRYGGDEFVIILADADHRAAMQVANRIRATIERHEFVQAEEKLVLKITASIGVATYPTHTRNMRELLKTADKAMYKAKDLSRNTVFLAPIPEIAVPK